MYGILFSRDAIKVLRRMPRNTARLIRSKIDGLAQDPYAPNNNVKKLVGRPGYRLRVGDWRVISDLENWPRNPPGPPLAPTGQTPRSAPKPTPPQPTTPSSPLTHPT